MIVFDFIRRRTFKTKEPLVLNVDGGQMLKAVNLSSEIQRLHRSIAAAQKCSYEHPWRWAIARSLHRLANRVAEL